MPKKETPINISSESEDQPEIPAEQERELLRAILVRAIGDYYQPQLLTAKWQHGALDKWIFEENDPKRFGSLHYIANHLFPDDPNFPDRFRQWLQRTSRTQTKNSRKIYLNKFLVLFEKLAA